MLYSVVPRGSARPVKLTFMSVFFRQLAFLANRAVAVESRFDLSKPK
jgi:hypothetical protein